MKRLREYTSVTRTAMGLWLPGTYIQRPEYVPAFPETPYAEVSAGVEEPAAEWLRFYAVKRGHHERARGGFTATSNIPFINFELLYHLDEISPRPILFIVGDRAHSRFFSDHAYEKALEPSVGCHIRSLRRKLSKGYPDAPFTIRCYRNIGYCLETDLK